MDMGYDVLSAAFLQGIRAPQQSPSFNPAMGSAHGCIPPSTHIPSMPSSYASLQLAAAAAIQQSPVSSDPAGRLTWGHVALAFGFILLDAAFSLGFGLKVESSLIIASLRCVFQLAMVANILAKVFATDDPWVVALIVCELPFIVWLFCCSGKLVLVRRKSRVKPFFGGGGGCTLYVHRVEFLFVCFCTLNVISITSLPSSPLQYNLVMSRKLMDSMQYV